MSSVVWTLLIGLMISSGLVGLGWSLRPRPPKLEGLLSAVEGAGESTSTGVIRSVNDGVDLLGYAQDRPRDLALLRIDPFDHGQRKVITALGFGAWLFLLLAVLTLGAIGVPLWAPPAAALVGAAIGFLWPDIRVRRAADDAREAFGDATGAFLGLARTLTLGGMEVNPALSNAADAGKGLGFEHLQRACAQARAENRQVSETLRELGQRVNLPVLEQVAGVLQSAADAGTPVSTALATRADMVLESLDHKMKMTAKERTEMMTIPTSLLTLLFILFIILPALFGMTVDFTGAGL